MKNLDQVTARGRFRRNKLNSRKPSGERILQMPNKVCCRSGISLIEAMNAILILSIAVIGAPAYRYCSTLDSRKAEAYITAARFGHLLCESWRGLGGNNTYDPVDHLSSGLTIALGPS